MEKVIQVESKWSSWENGRWKSVSVSECKGRLKADFGFIVALKSGSHQNDQSEKVEKNGEDISLSIIDSFKEWLNKKHFAFQEQSLCTKLGRTHNQISLLKRNKQKDKHINQPKQWIDKLMNGTFVYAASWIDFFSLTKKKRQKKFKKETNVGKPLMQFINRQP